MSGECPVGRTVYGAPCNGPGTYYCDSDVWGSACRRHFERATPAPAVPDHVGLREAITRLIADDQAGGWQESLPEELAAAVLALPEVAALLAERDDLAAKVAAGLALADEFDANANWREWGVGTRIRHTLGGPS